MLVPSKGASLSPCADGWPTQVTRSLPRSCCSARPIRSSTRVSTRASAPPQPTVTASESAGTATGRNLRELAGQIETPVFFAHIRASTGTPVQRSNCHPFRYGRWLWMHNGALRDFHNTKRDLVMAVDPTLYPDIEGSTDSETLFFLALTFGLTDDPFDAVARAIGLVEKVGHDHGVDYPFQGTVATTDGESIWAFRYSSEGKSRSLYFSTNVATLRQLHPEVEILHGLGEETRLVVSEPLGDLPGAWNEVPESAAGVIRPGTDEMRSFQPIAP